MTDSDPVKTSRRRFLAGSAMAAGAAASGIAGGALFKSGSARAVSTNARIVIAGAGAAGLSIATRLSRQLDGARITLIDSREIHLYQPGLTLVGTGIWEPAQVEDRNARYIPDQAEWIRDDVVAFHPDSNQVETSGGSRVDYDYLVVTTGLQLNFDEIEGMDPSLIGSDGIGCVYASPQNASRTWEAARQYIDEGGVGLFTRPPGPIKCAGAPLKVTMLIEDELQNNGTRAEAEMHYLPPGEGLFSQPDIHEFLKSYFPEQRDIAIDWSHPLTGIDPGNRRATFGTPEGAQTIDYDFIHVVPPMSAPDMIRYGDLGWQEGDFQGWMEVDQYSLQHRRYPNVFGAGDVVGTPVGKTAASVKAQAPVVADNVVAAIEDRELPMEWTGYTSCPLITEKGQAMLVEFDFSLEMTPSFDFLNPFEPQWAPWFLKERMLHAAYNAMMRGRV
ncbi:pyridine nucleotide-disulfide oxidoreductase [Spiribacter roseus]|uniref:NAD(P)/FAD-dependent oxidoreductase n=1 Tax=Spiribacter roseus TaxID=1855875 RepID=UPI000F705F45|nr:pyridine nucleotide-disulfide oxidoreductase [Spiribacter roseus]